MSEKLISADKLIQFVENWGKHLGRKEAAYSFLYAIHNVPAVDAVEVVRCKDCEAFYPKDKNLLQHCTRTGLVVSKNDFCSSGERREENECNSD